MLKSLPQEKWVFTNCNEKHATHALQLLGIEVSTTQLCLASRVHLLLPKSDTREVRDGPVCSTCHLVQAELLRTVTPVMM